MKPLIKTLIIAVFVALAFPMAALTAFGRIPALFLFGGHLFSMAPGIPGDYLRVAFYWMTLRSCSLRCRISFGSFFSNADAVVDEGVYIGPYSVLGRTVIGRGTQIATHVQVLSGARQHPRDEQGNIQGGHEGAFTRVSIGPHCWIGAAAIVMANVGDHTTIGAGAVVTKEIPSGVVAVGNPARVLRPIAEASCTSL